MSICNKYVINKIKPDNNWCLIYILDTKQIINLDAEKILYTQTIHNIKNEINPKMIYIYVADESQKNIIQNMFENVQDNLILNIGVYDDIIQLISNHGNDNNNYIIFTNNTGYINHSNNNKLVNYDLLYHIIKCQSSISTIISTDSNNNYNNDNCNSDNYNDNIAEILNQYEINYIIIPKIIVIPNHENNKIFINTWKNYFNKINHQNFDFKLKLSITLTNHKLNNPIKSLDHLIKSNKLITSLNNINIKLIYESVKSKNLTNNEFEFINSNNEYIYYPYIDFNISHHKYNKNNYFHIFNTNGYYSNKFDHNPFKDAFKRFEKVSQGSFILKPQTNHYIPKIINHIWTDDKISNTEKDYYSYLWKKNLKKPWIYKIWHKEDIDKYLSETKWNNLYQKAPSIIKDIIVSLAILEKYGGVIINSYTIPLKNIPDDMLLNKFFLGLDNDFNDNNELKLSYRIMASIPGQLNDKNKIIDPYAARRPFDGINNFFRSVKKKESDTFFQDIFVDLNKIELSNDSIDKIFLKNDDVFIYPNYYFNPNINIYPKRLLNDAIIINLWKLHYQEPRVKTQIKRSYIVTTEAIINKLKENPRDRLKNIKKI
ncbi:glycosyltransferase [Megavirus baoshan]|uniref:Glycosyltransferase n=1 Tax=Megavirus baoshan TaxID=2496520 RepID=A0A3S8UXE0_9VIRU|nr:glycosyltransferase [Megavirus baoshan]AZL89486.1 glycosyltransferase [Megavirus baoshan]